MDLLEHEGKSLLSRYGIATPSGILVSDAEEAVRASTSLGLPVVLKSQVPTGGRGKAGAILMAETLSEVPGAFERIMCTAVKGFLPSAVLVEKQLEQMTECYAAITLDRELGTPVLLFKQRGGVDVESAEGGMERWPIHPHGGIPQAALDKMAIALDEKHVQRGSLVDFSRQLWRMFWDMDCELLEINPLFISAAGKIIAGDAKVIIDDDALFRHPDIKRPELISASPFETSCRVAGFAGVDLGGQIAVVANGAGLTMAALDEIVDAGMSGACFLDMGGTDDPAAVERAITLASDRKLLRELQCVLVCIFGGLTKCDVVAEGIVAASSGNQLSVPLVIRLRGVNEELGRKILNAAGIKAHLNLAEAVHSVKETVRR